MIIIAFSQKTSRILPRIFCRRWRHCAPVIPMGAPNGGAFIMYQFVRRGRVEKIKLTVRDMERLRLFGWRFVCVSCAHATDDFLSHVTEAKTCVQLSRRAIGWRGRTLQTPAGFMRELLRR